MGIILGQSSAATAASSHQPKHTHTNLPHRVKSAVTRPIFEPTRSETARSNSCSISSPELTDRLNPRACMRACRTPPYLTYQPPMGMDFMFSRPYEHQSPQKRSKHTNTPHPTFRCSEPTPSRPRYSRKIPTAKAALLRSLARYNHPHPHTTPSSDRRSYRADRPTDHTHHPSPSTEHRPSFLAKTETATRHLLSTVPRRQSPRVSHLTHNPCPHALDPK